MKENDIQPTLYLLRWIRLLFSREFHIEDVMNIWDFLFSTATLKHEGGGHSVRLELPLVDYMCVSMCLFVRMDLLQGDNSMCLRRLLRSKLARGNTFWSLTRLFF